MERHILAAGDCLTVGELRRFIHNIPDTVIVVRQHGGPDRGCAAVSLTAARLRRVESRLSTVFEGAGKTPALLIR